MENVMEGMHQIDDKLMSTAVANESRRKSRLTLKDRCTKFIVDNEAFFVSRKGQQGLHMLPSTLKTRILQELARDVFGTPLHPATEHRLEMVKLLIHGHLTTFDFAVCGMEFGESEKEIWHCLAEKAGRSLRRVQDLRTNHTMWERTLTWCLPSVARMPRLEQLLLSTLSVENSGQLARLLKAAPQLRLLQIPLFNPNLQPYFSTMLNLGTNLNEFVFSPDQSGGLVNWQKFAIQVELSKAPFLEINTVRADRLLPVQIMVWHTTEENSISETYYLEHLCVAEDVAVDFNIAQLPNVKHLLLAESSSGSNRARVPVFQNLRTLHLRHHSFAQFVMPKLQLYGTNITTLILDAHFRYRPDRWMDLSAVLLQCRNVTCLLVRGCHVTVSHPRPRAEELLLQKLHLVRTNIKGKDSLSWLLRAPLLREVAIEDSKGVNVLDLQEATNNVRAGASLANLVSFQFTIGPWLYYPPSSFEESVGNFCKTVLACCPNLCQTKVELLLMYHQENKLWSFVDLVNY